MRVLAAHSVVMHRTITANVTAEPQRVLDIVSDLSTYPEWLELVSTVDTTGSESDEDGPAWFVTLRAKVGPFSRSKRLRMVRTATTNTGAHFDRREVDRRDHSAWTMTSDVEEGPDGTLLTIGLAYDGKLFTGPLEAILDAATEDAGAKLSAYAAS